MTFVRCIGCMLCRGTCLWGWGLDLKSWGQCSAALDGFRCRPWSESNESNESKVPHQTSFMCAPYPPLGLLTQMQANAATEANASKAGPKGQDFRCIRSDMFGPWSEI